MQRELGEHGIGRARRVLVAQKAGMVKRDVRGVGRLRLAFGVVQHRPRDIDGVHLGAR